MSVRWVPVAEVLRLHRRTVEVEPTRTYAEIGVRSFGRGLFHKDAIDGVSLGAKRVFEIDPGDLVVSNVFAWEGAVAVASEGEKGMIGSHRFMTWRPMSGEAGADFIAHYLLSDHGLEQLRRASPGSAGRNRTLGIAAFENLRIPLPGRDEELRIAARLDRIRDAAGLLSAPVHITELERAVWKAASGAPTRPMGSSVHQVSRPISTVGDTSYRMLGVRWYGEGLFVRTVLRGDEVAASTVYRVEPGDIVYNRLFAWKGSFATATDEHAGAVVSNEFPCFRVTDPHVMPEFVSAWLRRPEVWDEVGAQSTGSTPTSRNRFKVDRFLGLEVPVLEAAEQSRIVSALTAVRSLRKLASERQSLAGALLPAARNEEFSRLINS